MVYIPPPIAVQHANAQIIFNYFKTRLTPIQTCGILSQTDHETGFNPLAQGDKSKGEYMAFGLFQWHSARYDLIANGDKYNPGCGINVHDLVLAKDGDVTKQCEAAWHELQHSEHHALAKITSATTPYEAGYNAAKFWIRPGKAGQYEARGFTAQYWAKYFVLFKTPPTIDISSIIITDPSVFI